MYGLIIQNFAEELALHMELIRYELNLAGVLRKRKLCTTEKGGCI
jgi:hypothetical protein